MIDELSGAEIDDLLRDQAVGRIGCHTDGLTYVVPVIYAYDGEELYGTSMEGQKTRMMRENPSVCFEVDEYDGAGSWRSAIVQGLYESSTARTRRAQSRCSQRASGAPMRKARRASGTARTAPRPSASASVFAPSRGARLRDSEPVRSLVSSRHGGPSLGESVHPQSKQPDQIRSWARRDASLE